MTKFFEVQPTTENRWRALILLGRNSTSYKFALATALLDLNRLPGDLIKIDELALPFAKALSRHMYDAPQQGARGLNKAMQAACSGFNDGSVNAEQLRDVAVKYGFGDVIDAFHMLSSGAIEQPFFVDERITAKGIRLTDEMRLLAAVRHASLAAEVDARWRVVETGWELGVAPSIIDYDRSTGDLTLRSAERRMPLRSCCSTLNGYQKGKCFYCFAPISIEAGLALADVDHFFPWSLQSRFALANGIWNLVLSCQKCNRGSGGKSDMIPDRSLLERLHRRNEFYVESKHKLAATIIAQTGLREAARKSFLQATFQALVEARIHTWKPSLRGEAAF